MTILITSNDWAASEMFDFQYQGWTYEIPIHFSSLNDSSITSSRKKFLKIGDHNKLSKLCKFRVTVALFMFNQKGDKVMPTYIVLMKLTDQGIKAIKNGPQRARENAKLMEKMGSKMTGFYLTMGEYDYVAIGEAPNDEVVCTFMLGLGAAGFVRTTTLKAFTLEEYEKIVKNLP